MRLLLLLGLLLPVLVAAGPPRLGCRGSHRRSLLQAADPGTIDPSPPETISGVNGTLVQTLEVDVLQEMCIVTSNSYFLVGVGGDAEVASPSANLQASAEECCASCAADTLCNAWQWCPREPGCGQAVGSSDRFPYMGCQLLRVAAFSPYIQGFSPVRQTGPDVPFIAGAPFNMTLPQIPSYGLSPGTDMGGLYDFSCAASSVAESCMVIGPAQTVARVCESEPECKGFVYFPEGVAFDGSGPVGVLKADNGEDRVDTTKLVFNPTAATYLRTQDAAGSSGGGGGGGGSGGGGSGTTIAIVVSTVVGVMVVGVIATLLVMRRKYKRMAADAVADSEKRSAAAGSGSPPGSASPTGDTSGASSDVDLGHSGGKLSRQNSPPSVVRTSSAAPSGTWEAAQAGAYSYPVQGLDQVVVVNEVPGPGSSGRAPGSSGGMPPGSSARELLEAFSQMYAHRPPVDYVRLAEMLDDDEAAAARAREAAQEAAFRAADIAERRRRLEAGLSPIPSDDEEDEEDGYEEETSMVRTPVEYTPAASSDESYGAAAAAGLTSGPTSADTVWSILPEDVEVCRRPDGSWWQLGTGAFGTVYKGLYRGERSVAIKVLHRLEEPRHTEAFAREVALLKTLRDRNVVQFLGACVNGPQGTAMLVTELMELGDLWRALPARDAAGRRLFAWAARGRQVMEDVARGLAYLHSKRIVHFDLKSANILLSRAGTAKLADIGMARVLHKSYLSMVSSGLGTFAWSAPEVLAGRRCGCKADIYSWGVVLWEICTGEAPVRGVMRPLRAPVDCPAEVVALHARCIAEDPAERPTAAEILEILSGLS